MTAVGFGSCFAESDFQEYMMGKAGIVNKALDASLPMQYPESVHEVRNLGRHLSFWVWVRNLRHNVL